MIVINAGLLIDGTGATPRENVRLFVVDSRITDIVDIQESAVPDGAQVVDATQHVVMPGMIDTHVHLIWNGIWSVDSTEPTSESRANRVSELPGMRALKAYSHACKDLEAGCTTIRDMHCYDFADISLRDSINSGLVVGPRVMACGCGLTSTFGHMDLRNGLRPDVSLGGFNNVVDSVVEARRATRYLIGMRVDHIKISASNSRRVKGRPIFFSPEMRFDVLQAICEEAHSAGRTVAAHSQGCEGELWAVQAGVDSLEHAHFLSDDIIELMAEKGTFLIPTMTHCVRAAKRTREAPPEQAKKMALYPLAFEGMYRVLSRARELGVRIATGTDAGASGVAHGDNATELELLTTVGMSPMEAIVAATKTAAQVLDMADSIGTLKKGKYADLLVVKGKPLEDISLLQDKANILVVMKDGQIVVRRSETQGVRC